MNDSACRLLQRRQARYLTTLRPPRHHLEIGAQGPACALRGSESAGGPMFRAFFARGRRLR
jgi:hypothetical protein